MSQFYVSTPLYYVNDKPHVGHAYTTIAADVATRWNRLCGKESFFLTGTDEHGQKVFRAAAARGIDTQAHVDELVNRFKELWTKLDIQYSDFIRTTETRHTEVVQAVLQKLYDSGDIYAADYEGWYSTSAEKFWTEKDLVDGKCPDTGQTVEWLAERNYFFRMSNYTEQLKDWIEANPDFILPEGRKNEVLGYLRKDVNDLCISRLKSRMSWGIPLPFDDDYVTYVWFDALLNYITALGYHPDPKKCSKQFHALWPASFQVLGKDILTTHSVYWGTMLFALGLTPANHLFAHGWWTVEGQKMSKSIGNVVDPHLLIRAYGADAIRFFLLREVPFGLDGNFSFEALQTRYNAELANDLGNLAHRSLSMTERWLGGQVPELDEPQESDIDLEQTFKSSISAYTKAMNSFQFSVALEAMFVLVRKGNKYIDINQPWRIAKTGDLNRLGGVMRRCLEVCRVAGMLLRPFMPTKSEELLTRLKAPEAVTNNLTAFAGLKSGEAVSAGNPIFPKISDYPEEIREKLEAAGLLKPKPDPKQKKQNQGSAFIKSKVFKRVAFQSGTVRSATKSGDSLKLQVEIADKNLIDIQGSYPTDGEELIGSGVIVAQRDTLGSFEKIKLVTGKIISAKPHPDATKLLHLAVDLGEKEPRSIVAGIADRFKPEELINLPVTAVANLRPSELRGIRSEGMLLAAGGDRLQSMVCAAQSPVGLQAIAFGSDTHVLLQIKSKTSQQLMGFSEATDPGVVVR